MAEQITPEGLRKEAGKRTAEGYVYIATVRGRMRELANHMEKMAPYQRTGEVTED